VDGFNVTRLEDGRIRVTIAGETIEAEAATWRAVLFDCKAREALRAIVSRDLAAAPITSPVWWNGDGR
jgi:hypothetical protein